MGEYVQSLGYIATLGNTLNQVIDIYKKLNTEIVSMRKTDPEAAEEIENEITHVMNDFMERLNGEALEPFDIEEN